MHIKFFLYLLIIIITIWLTSCNTTTSVDDIILYEISEILQDIATDFNFDYDLDGIMTHFSSDFLHKERNFDEEKQFWQSLLYQYTSVSIENITISEQFNGRLFASFNIAFKKDSTTQTYNEPSDEFGNLSYFIRENGKWKIIGKDEW